MIRRCLFLLAITFAAGSLEAEARRLVLVKVDGLPSDLIEQLLEKRDPQTGRSALPWIQAIFIDHGAWVRNFYTRGISLSAPSWSILDSGQHLTIRGNAEFDRFNPRVYDYLNFFPFYAGYARDRRVDMPGAEVLDQCGIPLLMDQFAPLDRYDSMQLFQRSVHWITLRKSLTNRVIRPARELINEWQTGFEMSPGLEEEQEKEILSRLADPNILYLDFYLGDYDHVAHLTNDPASQLAVIQRLDARLGRLWTAIQASSLANQTVLALVSDHGMNSTPGTYSQGYSLIKFFNSAAMGGHHVVTVRHPMTEYKLRGLDPFVSYVVTPSGEASYLRNQNDYPTALIDPDGNERASVQLRNGALNAIHILLLQLKNGDLDATQRAAARNGLLRIIEANRPTWTQTVTELNQELQALQSVIERQKALIAADPRKFTREDVTAELDDVVHRHRVTLDTWVSEQRGYGEYVHAIQALLDLREPDLDPSRIRIETLIPKRIMGEPNTLYQLQNYPVSLSRNGLELNAGGSLDLDGTFRRVNNFAVLANVRVRNLVQREAGNAPIDFIAARIPAAALELPEQDRPASDPVWAYADDSHQALLLSQIRQGTVWLRYMPVRDLAQDAAGKLHYKAAPWAAGVPLHLFEDPQLNIPGSAWLSQWHTEQDWFEAIHRTRYSNGLIGLYEHFTRWRAASLPPVFRIADPGDQDVLRRYVERRRQLVESDLLIFAADHWNFNMRGFNPGGNHGSFLRISTHSVLMAAGSGIQPGIAIDRPYDGLSLVPTLLTLLGRPAESYPGPVIREMIR